VTSTGAIWKETDPKGRVLTMLRSTWEGHISADHMEVDSPEAVRLTVADPDFIVGEINGKSRSSVYYRQGACATFPELKLAVVAQWETDERGRVVTAYVTKRAKSKGEIEWVRQLQR